MKRTSKMTSRLAGLALLVILVAAAAAACTGTPTPPGANKYLGSFEQGGYLFLRWQEGLEVMIWHDVAGSAVAHSAGSTEDRVYAERGSARSADGRSFEWELQTTDGKTGQVRIGKASYDLSAGTLFIVSTHGGTTDVRQLDRDLSAVPLDHEGILAFAENDPDLADLVNANVGAAPEAESQAVPSSASQGTPAEINLEAVLWISTTLPDGDPVELEFTLINHSETGWYVLKWYTPLEGFGGEILRVERDGQRIPYRGPEAERGDPTPDGYIFLDAGASVSATVDLAEAYDCSEPGEYTIALISPRISHVARTEGEMATSVDDLGPVAMPSNQVSVTILEDL